MAASCDVQALNAYTHSVAGQQESVKCFMSKCMGATSESAKKCCGVHCAVTVMKRKYPACTPMYEAMVRQHCSGSDYDVHALNAYTHSAAGQQASVQCYMSKCMGATSDLATRCCGLHCAVTVMK